MLRDITGVAEHTYHWYRYISQWLIDTKFNIDDFNNFHMILMLYDTDVVKSGRRYLVVAQLPGNFI